MGAQTMRSCAVVAVFFVAVGAVAAGSCDSVCYVDLPTPPSSSADASTTGPFFAEVAHGAGVQFIHGACCGGQQLCVVSRAAVAHCVVACVRGMQEAGSPDRVDGHRAFSHSSQLLVQRAA